MVVRRLRLGRAWHRAGPGSVGVAGLRPSVASASTAAGDRTLLPRPARPAWRGPASALFIHKVRSACVHGENCINERDDARPGPARPGLPTHNAGHSQIFNERVLHTHAHARGQTDRRTDGETPAAGHRHTYKDHYVEAYSQSSVAVPDRVACQNVRRSAVESSVLCVGVRTLM